MKKNNTSGFAILIVVMGIILTAFFLMRKGSPEGNSATTNPGSLATVKGLVSSEKNAFTKDPDVIRILRDRYHLELSATTLGSVDLVRAGKEGYDFLWPASDVNVHSFEAAYGKNVTSSPIFNSPVVIYSWDRVADALKSKGMVTRDAKGVYWISDLPKLVDLVKKDAQWQSLGLDLYGTVRIVPTDPSRSNSGLMAAALFGSMMNKGKVLTDQSLQQLWPDIRAFYDKLGFLEESSRTLFTNYLGQGVGKYPMVVGYENQLVEYAAENPTVMKDKANGLRVLYPKPTVWANHPVIALKENGRRLLEALQDPEIQKIAWEKHGFRSGVSGVQNRTDVVSSVTIPKEITSAMQSPSGSVMQKLSGMNKQ